MATNVATLTAKLTADSSSLKRGLGRAERDVQGFGSKSSKVMAGFGKAAVAGAAVAAAAIVGTAVKSVAAFADFEKGMNEVFTLLPGITDKAMGAMEKDVKDFSKKFGVLPDKVVPSLYQALSAGVPKDNVFEFMEVATKASIGGATDLETAVDGLTSVVNAYGAENIDAAEASDIMFTAVRLGKTTMDELSRSLFQVNPVAAALGVKFGDVSAALAAMTAQGTPTRVATTQLRQAFVELGKEGTIASDVFKETTGQTFPDFIAAGGTVEDAFMLMKDKADDMGVGVGDLFGSVEAGMGVISLTSESGAKAFSKATGEMTDSAGAAEDAFGTMDKGLSRAWDRIKTTVTVGLIDLGEKLAPFVEKMADWLQDMLPGAIDFLMDAFDKIMPVVEDVWDAIVDLGPALQIIADEAIIVAREVAGMAAPLLDVLTLVGDLGGATKDTEGNATGLGQALGWMSTANRWAMKLNPVALVLDNVDRAMGHVKDSSEDTGTVFEYYAGTMADVSKDVEDTVGDMTDEVSDELGDMTDEVSDDLGDMEEDFVSWEEEIHGSMASVINLFDAAPEKIKTSVAEMIANVREQRVMAEEFERGMTILAAAGMDALVEEFKKAGPAAVDQVTMLAGDLNSAWELEMELDAILGNEVGSMGVDQAMIDRLKRMGMTLAQAINAGFVPNLNLMVTGGGEQVTVSGAGYANWTDPKPMAAGGIVTSPTRALIGEAGPEAVIPLSDMNRGGTTVIVEGNLFGAATVDDLVAMIEEGRRDRSLAGGVMI